MKKGYFTSYGWFGGGDLHNMKTLERHFNHIGTHELRAEGIQKSYQLLDGFQYLCGKGLDRLFVRHFAGFYRMHLNLNKGWNVEIIFHKLILNRARVIFKRYCW